MTRESRPGASCPLAKTGTRQHSTRQLGRKFRGFVERHLCNVVRGICWDYISTDLLNIPPSLINLVWEIVGPLMISEAYLDDITQYDIDLANKAREFYMKPFGVGSVRPDDS